MDALKRLLELLDLESLEVNLFRGRSPEERQQRVFGGQVLAQALVAARRTVDEDRQAHSLHAYFLRPGDPDVPILYQVDRIRDGKSFTTRRVVAIQHGRPIFNMSTSFQVEEAGFDHQMPMPEVDEPDTLPGELELAERHRASAPPDKLVDDDWMLRERPIEQRFADAINWYQPVAQEPLQRVWLRASGELPDAQDLQQAVLAYASDLSLLDAATMPHAVTYFDDRVQIASLDHAMWFHRPFRADEWLLYVCDSPSGSNARGFARGSVYDRGGRLVASVAQEGLIRRRPVSGARGSG
jgi:acyl-CoA thioesterase-2